MTSSNARTNDVWKAVWLATAIWLLPTSAASALAADFFGIGFLNDEYSISLATDVSADGRFVVGSLRVADDTVGGEGFLWSREEGMIGIGLLPEGPFSSASAVSDDGRIIAGGGPSAATGQSALQTLRWSQAMGPEGLQVPGRVTNRVAMGISGDGAVLVGFGATAGSDFAAWRWTQQDGIVELGDPPIEHSRATAASYDGSVIVGAEGNEPFRWTAEDGITRMGFLPGAVPDPAGLYGFANDVTPDGAVIVGRSLNSAAKSEAFLWTAAAGMTGLAHV